MPFTKENARERREKAGPRTEGKVQKLVKEVVFDVFHYLQTSAEARKKRANLQAWSEDNPRDFYNIASKLINIQVTHEGNPLYPVIFKLDGKFTENNPDNPGISKEPGSIPE